MELSLAYLLFDYLCLACLGEARHAVDKCGCILSQFNDKWSAYDARNVVAKDCAGEYCPKEFLPVLYELFSAENDGGGSAWASNYGGEPWAKLAEAANNFLDGTWSPLVLIDHCVDLVHNGGLCFDKGFLLMCKAKDSDLRNLLDDKASRKPLHRWRGSQEVGGVVWSIIKAMQKFGLVGNPKRNIPCAICGHPHEDFTAHTCFMYDTSSAEALSMRKKTLADNGYLPIRWPETEEEARYTVGYVQANPEKAAPGCDLNNNEPCNGDCCGCPHNHGGCDLNDHEPCDGDCQHCSYFHPGCDLNNHEPCDGDCGDCEFNHGGCQGNEYEPCSGECTGCPYSEEEAEESEEEEEVEEEQPAPHAGVDTFTPAESTPKEYDSKDLVDCNGDHYVVTVATGIPKAAMASDAVFFIRLS